MYEFLWNLQFSCLKVPAPITYPLTTPQVPVYGMVRSLICFEFLKTELSLPVGFMSWTMMFKPSCTLNVLAIVCKISLCIERDYLGWYSSGSLKLWLYSLCVSIFFFSTILQMQKDVSCGSSLNFIYLVLWGFCFSHRYLLRLELLLWWHPRQWCTHSLV